MAIRPDAAIPPSQFDTVATDGGITLPPIMPSIAQDGSLRYSLVDVAVDRLGRTAMITLCGPDGPVPGSLAALHKQGDQAYLLRLARELDDAILHLPLNEAGLTLWAFRSEGDPELLLAHEAFLTRHRADSLANETLLLWQRLLQRLDATALGRVALVEHGSCFAGVLAEVLWSVDRSAMMEGYFVDDDQPLASITLSPGNFGAYPMDNGLTRGQTRFLADPSTVDGLQGQIGLPMEADDARHAGLITFAVDESDWDDEIRRLLEDHASSAPPL